MRRIDNEQLAKLYHAQTLSVDMLPYTPEMEAIVTLYNTNRVKQATPLELYRSLINLRKNRKLQSRRRALAVEGKLFS